MAILAFYRSVWSLIVEARKTISLILKQNCLSRMPATVNKKSVSFISTFDWNVLKFQTGIAKQRWCAVQIKRAATAWEADKPHGAISHNQRSQSEFYRRSMRFHWKATLSSQVAHSVHCYRSLLFRLYYVFMIRKDAWNKVTCNLLLRTKANGNSLDKARNFVCNPWNAYLSYMA